MIEDTTLKGDPACYLFLLLFKVLPRFLANDLPHRWPSPSSCLTFVFEPLRLQAAQTSLGFTNVSVRHLIVLLER